MKGMRGAHNLSFSEGLYMLLKRVGAVILFLILLFLFFRQDSTVIEGVENDIPYHIEIEDNLTLFYFQCPSYQWDVGGNVPTVWVNGYDYDPVYEDSWCDTRINWEIRPESGDSFILTTTGRGVVADQIWGLLLFTVFLWLLIGSFSHSQVWDRLAMFSLLWAFTYAMHLISYEYYRTTFSNNMIFTLFPILALVLVLVNPRGILPLVLLASGQLIEYWVLSPYSSNHTMTIAMINLVILITLATLLFRVRRIDIDREQFYDLLSPVLRVMVLVLYFWAWFHKLNSDFVSPASCAIEFYGTLRLNFPIFPHNGWFVVPMTILVEGGLPLLLLFRPTRLIAILIGVGFHGTLGLITFRDFSGLMFCLYFTFLSVEGLEHIKHLRPYIMDYIPAWLKHLLWALVIMILVMPLPGIRFQQDKLAIGLFINAVYTGLAMLVTLYLLYQQWIKNDRQLLAPIFRPRSVLLWLVPILMMINGMMPFIGLKTNNSYDMYSNLRVEGDTNHILPINGHIFGYPDDIVRIVSASNDFSYREDVDYVFLAFRENVYQQKPAVVNFRRNGETYRIERGNYEAVLGVRLPLLLRKFMIFEPVSRDSVNPCTH